MFSKVCDLFPRRVMEVLKNTIEVLNKKRIQEEARKHLCNFNGMRA